MTWCWLFFGHVLQVGTTRPAAVTRARARARMEVRPVSWVQFLWRSPWSCTVSLRPKVAVTARKVSAAATMVALRARFESRFPPETGALLRLALVLPRWVKFRNTFAASSDSFRQCLPCRVSFKTEALLHAMVGRERRGCAEVQLTALQNSLV